MSPSLKIGILRDVFHRYGKGENLTVCILFWPDGPPTVSKQDYM